MENKICKNHQYGIIGSGKCNNSTTDEYPQYSIPFMYMYRRMRDTDDSKVDTHE